jgi:hypothetical protein
MDTQTFINQVAAGDAVGAKDLLNDILSSKAFEALDAKKVEMSQAIFSGEEPEVQDTEETETETE